MNTITSSNDWLEVDRYLRSLIATVRYNRDLVKMHQNIDRMISDLSRQEVEARRLKNPKYLEPAIKQINEAIHNMEKWILMLQLSQ
jgi:hypothetical protein